MHEPQEIVVDVLFNKMLIQRLDIKVEESKKEAAARTHSEKLVYFLTESVRGERLDIEVDVKIVEYKLFDHQSQVDHKHTSILNTENQTWHALKS